MTKEFVFYTKPIPKGRPRLGKHGTYTPPRTKAFENFIKVEARKQMGNGNIFEKRIILSILFYFKEPQKTVLEHPGSDLDNCCKAIMDAFNGVVYNDDKNVVFLKASKDWYIRDEIHVLVEGE